MIAMRNSMRVPSASAVAFVLAAAGIAAGAGASSASATTAPRTPQSIECSKQADAKGLHGKPRETFRAECKRQAENNAGNAHAGTGQSPIGRSLLNSARVRQAAGPAAMTPEEQFLITRTFDRMSAVPVAAKDIDAERLISQQLDGMPDAPYRLVQSVLVQEQALERLSERLRHLEDAVANGVLADCGEQQEHEFPIGLSRTTRITRELRASNRCSGQQRTATSARRPDACAAPKSRRRLSGFRIVDGKWRCRRDAFDRRATRAVRRPHVVIKRLLRAATSRAGDIAEP